MDYFVIEVPDMNDSVVKVSLQSRLYQLRFTWNDTGGYWMLGVMDSLGTPLLLGVKMVPQFPLNLLFGRDDMPGSAAAATAKVKYVLANAVVCSVKAADMGQTGLPPVDPATGLPFGSEEDAIAF